MTDHNQVVNQPEKEKPEFSSMAAPAVTEPLWTVEQVAAYLQKEPDTVRQMARSGELKAYKVGREWRFRKKLIDDYLTVRINPEKKTPAT